MKTFLLGFIFGLLAVVHSSPITDVTQMPSKAEDEILQVVTDGFLIDVQRLTTESTKNTTTVPVPEQTSTVSVEKVFEGSASGESTDLFPSHVGEHFTTTTIPTTTTTSTSGVSQQTSTVSGVKDDDLLPPQEGEHITTTATTTTTTAAAAATATTAISAASQPMSTVSGGKDTEGSASGDLFPTHDGEHFTTTPTTTTTTSAASQQTSTVFGVKDFEGSASGDLFPTHDGEHFTTTPTTTTTISAASPQSSTVSEEKTFEGSALGESPDLFPLDEVHSTTPPTIAAPVIPRGSRTFGINKESEFEQGDSTSKDAKTDEIPPSVDVRMNDKDINMNNEPQKGNTEMHKGHATPGWIIIVAFIVGLAALIMICVAIATRDKWNGPKQAAQLETNTNATNQQKDQEMETFLPKENGKPSEYTVIPLDELPEKYSSD